MDSKQQGNVAEQSALKHLQAAGLSLIAQNFTSKFGEIDLIMADGSDQVFVEVRYRKSAAFGSALESINIVKQQRIIKTAQVYLQKTTSRFQNYRFDVVAITQTTDKDDMIWLKNAFQLN